MALHVHRSLVKWGNGYGIRLTRKEVERLGLHAGDPVEADVHAMTGRNDVEALPSWPLGGGDIDSELEEEWDDGR